MTLRYLGTPKCEQVFRNLVALTDFLRPSVSTSASFVLLQYVYDPFVRAENSSLLQISDFFLSSNILSGDSTESSFSTAACVSPPLCYWQYAAVRPSGADMLFLLQAAHIFFKTHPNLVETGRLSPDAGGNVRFACPIVRLFPSFLQATVR